MSNEMETDLENLSGELDIKEIKSMLSVLDRNEEFERNELERLRRLHIEIEYLKKILPRNDKKSLRCVMCNSLFIPIINSFYECHNCRLEVCSNCVLNFKSPADINLCKICHAERLHKLKSGKWLIGKSSAEKQNTIFELALRLSALENEKSYEAEVKAKLSNLSAAHKRFEDILNYDVKNNYGSTWQFGNGRTSPSMGSYKVLSEDNVSKFNIVSGLKSKYQIKVSTLKDECDDNFNDRSSNNSTPSTSESYYTISTLPKNPRQINGFSKGHFKHDFDKEIRASTHSISQKSLSSYNSDTMFSDLVIHGEVHVEIEYLPNQSHLQLKIVECKGLSVADRKENVTNPYVKLYLLPDRSSKGKRKTTVKKNTTNPIFNEVLHFHIDKLSINQRTLNISVWHFKASNERIFMGETNISLSDVDFNNSKKMWLPLHSKENGPKLMSLYLYKGEVLVGLRYISGISKNTNETIPKFESGTFTIFIRNGRNLGDSKHIPNAYVKCSFTYKSSKTSVKKTKVVDKTTNPIWDTEFVYEDIDKKGLCNSKVELTVLSKKLQSDYPLGKLLFKKNCTEDEVGECKEKDVLLWRNFLNSNNSNIFEDYLPLRSSIE